MKVTQETIDSLASNLDITYKVIDNLKDGRAVYRIGLTFTNKSSCTLEYGKWAIYFCHIRLIEPEILPDPDGVMLKEYGLKISHLNGYFFKMEPTEAFKALKPNESLDVYFKAQFYSVSRSDILPNWYITGEKTEPKVIKCTAPESLDFVASFDRPEKWKRFDYITGSGLQRFDVYDPYTPQVRFAKNSNCSNFGKPENLVIPTPYSVEINNSQTVLLQPGSWKIVVLNEDLQSEADFLSGMLNIEIEPDQSLKNKSHVICLKTGDVDFTVNGKPVHNNPEAYKLEVNSTLFQVNIIGATAAGVYYGIQTLLSLVDGPNLHVPDAIIKDCPRFNYRGMHVDVSRNFYGKKEIMKILDVMAMYKMNKFHFHLTDDEGWRLEIPGLEELTQVGGKRGHDLSEKFCILPQLGSGPDSCSSGSGYYSVQDYIDILAHAKKHHIQVIPEVDIPGHSHAAVVAMKARFKKYMELGEEQKAKEYLLIDLKDKCLFQSVQMYSDNVINPGVESTYKFIDKVVSEIKKMHDTVSPLEVFHFGGDEVPYEAWESSPSCRKLVKDGIIDSLEDLMSYFVQRVAKIIASHDLLLGVWQDGVIMSDTDLQPFERDSLPNKDVYVYAWQNVWESGLAGSANTLANNDYKVVMAHATHLYFDHPQEPDPEERGLYWAARYIDTFKAFSYTPENVFANADHKLTGEPIKKENIMEYEADNHSLKRSDNIIGMQGQLWSELIRTNEQLQAMIFPRLLAVAERSWHKAVWENKDSGKVMLKDWEQFSNSLGHKELLRLDRMNVSYHIPPPGAQLTEEGKLEVNVAYPGLPIQLSLDSGVAWQDFTPDIKLQPQQTVLLRTLSADRQRNSRSIKMAVD